MSDERFNWWVKFISDFLSFGIFASGVAIVVLWVRA